VPPERQPNIQSVAATVEAIRASLQDMQASRVVEAEVIEQQIQEIRASLRDMQASGTVEAERIWTALGALAGLDGIAAGMADIGELLAPLRQLVPPTTALPLEDGVPEALQRIRAALGVPDRNTNFQSVNTDWDGPVGYIGEVDRPDRRNPDPNRERVA
jgi:hypothetical protein